MTDEKLSKPNSSAWNFEHLQHEEESANTEDFFSVLKKNISKNVYLGEQTDSTEKTSNDQRTGTVRVDSSDLISRCKQFLPLLTDANRTLFSQMKSGENVRIELDSDEDDNESRRIEMDLMFCPNEESISQSDDSSDDEPTNTKLLPNSQENKSVRIIELSSTNIDQAGADDVKKTDDIVNK